MKLIILSLLTVLFCGCTSIQKIGQTVNHPSGWSDQVIDLAGHSWLYSQLSQNVYGNSYDFKLPKTVKDVESFEDVDSDFFATLYRNSNTQDYILVFRGTDSPKDFKKGNNPFAQIQNQRGIETYDQCVKKYEVETLIVAGQPLGGGIATHVSLNRKVTASYSFNGSPIFKKRGANIENMKIQYC